MSNIYFTITCFKGLLTEKRLEENHPLLPHHEKYLRKEKSLEGINVLAVVKTAKPTIIMGLSGQGGIFSEDILREMGRINERPVIFAMSNPSDHAECTSNQAFSATDGRAIFASGSPFQDFTTPDGKVCKSNQGNNMYIFPGIGLGVISGGCRLVTQGMILCAAEALAMTLKPEEFNIGMIYPDIENIRQVSFFFFFFWYIFTSLNRFHLMLLLQLLNKV